MPLDRVTPIGTFLTGNLVEAAAANEGPGGKIGRDRRLSNSTGTDTGGEVILEVTCTVNTDREIDVFATVTVRSDIPGGCHAALFEDGVQIQRKNQDLIDTTKDLSWSFFAQQQPSAGSHTYQVTTGPSGAAGNFVTAVANGQTGTHGTCDLMVWDSGPKMT